MSDEPTPTPVHRITGKVKWFNNKSGFGFVTAVDGELKGSDIFVHFSSINVPDDQYKYLVQGEYVDFELSKSEKSEHEYHAVNISGVKGGSLMCETRKLTSDTRPYKPRVYKTPDERKTAASAESAESSGPKKKYSKRGPPKDSEGFTKIPVRKPKTETK
jgi:CspA family cold shock protein